MKVLSLALAIKYQNVKFNNTVPLEDYTNPTIAFDRFNIIELKIYNTLTNR